MICVSSYTINTHLGLYVPYTFLSFFFRRYVYPKKITQLFPSATFCNVEARDLAKHLREEDRGQVANMKRLVTFVGKFADWKRLDAVLYAAKEYEVPVVPVSNIDICFDKDKG